MVAKDALQAIESILSEKDLVRIQEKYSITELIKLELLGPSKKVTTRSVILVA